MAEGATPSPVIIKKVKKGGGHGHHGGAWKVAYADFVTAMMAFFLLLWLLNAVTQEQLEGISNHFAPVSASDTTSGAGGVLGGQVIAEEGAMPNVTSRPSATLDLPPPRAGTGGGQSDAEMAAEQAEAIRRQQEQQDFERVEAELRQAIASLPDQKMADSLLIDNTPEGLRIQLVDQDGLAMFPSGRAQLFEHTMRALDLVAGAINKMPQDVKVAGHTDATPFRTQTGYGNWELSSDRANSARRYLEFRGVPEVRWGQVVGKAATEPLLVADPNNQRNRRLEIVLLRGTGPGAPGAKSGSGGQSALPEEALPGLRAIDRGSRQELENITGKGGSNLQIVPSAR
ncbi:MAG: flagellar motor protein MotB [Magnetovibrionaceae bacterium]